jgi:hypothetical protein
MIRIRKALLVLRVVKDHSRSQAITHPTFLSLLQILFLPRPLLLTPQHPAVGARRPVATAQVGLGLRVLAPLDHPSPDLPRLFLAAAAWALRGRARALHPTRQVLRLPSCTQCLVFTRAMSAASPAFGKGKWIEGCRVRIPDGFGVIVKFEREGMIATVELDEGRSHRSVPLSMLNNVPPKESNKVNFFFFFVPLKSAMLREYSCSSLSTRARERLLFKATAR